MKHTSILILTILFWCINLHGQNRTIQGRVLSEELEPLPGLEIKNSKDSVLVATDFQGYFEINISNEIDSLFFHYLGMENTSIKVSPGCRLIEIIILAQGLYHYRSLNRIDRHRKRRFNSIANLHLEAVQKGVFKNKKICYERAFVPIKPELHRIRKELQELSKETLNHFKDLEVGDILKIPLGFDSSGRSVNTYYSICGDCTEDDYDFIVEAELINKRKKHLTLELRILDMNSRDFIEYEGKTLKIGDTFKYQMKYFEVIIN